MSRYRGPRLRIMRALGVNLPGLSRRTIERKPYPPGQHKGVKRTKRSTFGKQLLEKQKLRFNYAVSETQLKRVVYIALKQRGNPGDNLLSLLERRLDNAVFRAGFAPTVLAARQLVGHGHVKVNGKRVNIASFLTTIGQRIEVTPKGQKIPFVQHCAENPALATPQWIKVNAPFTVDIVAIPGRDSVPVPIEISTIIEFYSRRT